MNEGIALVLDLSLHERVFIELRPLHCIFLLNSYCTAKYIGQVVDFEIHFITAILEVPRELLEDLWFVTVDVDTLLHYR